jgi:hypothetical integral membrane protein (TIGR02206 family)
MGPFFARDYSGEPFELFGPAHLVALGVVALINLSFILLRRNPDQRLRRAVRYGLAALLIVNEVGWHIWIWQTGQWTVQAMLPLHLCTLFIWLSPVMLLTRSYAIYEFAFFLGIGGAFQTLLTPDLGPYGFPHYRFFQIFISHGASLTAAIYMTVVEGYRPHWKSLLRVIVWTNVYLAFIFGLNLLIGSNYMYVASKPPTSSLLDYMGPWPWYILGMEAVGLLTCLILYLPFAIRDWRTRAAVG